MGARKLALKIGFFGRFTTKIAQKYVNFNFFHIELFTIEISMKFYVDPYIYSKIGSEKLFFERFFASYKTKCDLLASKIGRKKFPKTNFCFIRVDVKFHADFNVVKLDLKDIQSEFSSDHFRTTSKILYFYSCMHGT